MCMLRICLVASRYLLEFAHDLCAGLPTTISHDKGSNDCDTIVWLSSPSAHIPRTVRYLVERYYSVLYCTVQ